VLPETKSPETIENSTSAPLLDRYVQFSNKSSSTFSRNPFSNGN
jgi:hypothetical protein